MTRILVVSHPAVLPANQHLYRELRARGWDIKLVVPNKWTNEYGAITARPLSGMEGAFIPRQVLSAGRPQRHVYISPPPHLLRRLRPDVLFLEEESFSLCAAQWSRAAMRLGVPYGIQATDNLDRTLPYPMQRSRAAVLTHAAFVAARSPAAASLARKWGAPGVPEVVPRLMPLWKPEQRHHHAKFTIGFVGRLAAATEIADLLTAFRLMTAPARLIFVGQGPITDQLAEESGVEICARNHPDNMRAAYAQIDLLVLPSRPTPAREEQSGRLLVEALVCGIPVITSDTAESNWILKATGGGWLTPDGDTAALAALLDQVATDETARRARAETGSRAAADLFSLRAVADKMGALLTDAADCPQSTALGAPSCHREDGADTEPLPITLVAHDVGGRGGMERVHAEIIVRMASHRRVTVISTSIDPSLRALATWKRIRVPRRPAPLRFVFFFFVGGWQLRRNGTGLVHTCGAIVPNRTDIASVHLCHAGFVTSTGHLAPAEAPVLRRLNTGLQRSLALAAELWCYRRGRAGMIHAVSKGVAAEIEQHFRTVRILTIPNAVDASVFRPDLSARASLRKRLGVSADVTVALFVGGAWDHKGLIIAIQSLAHARQTGADIRLWVVGKGDVKRFTKYAIDAGVSESVRFFGQLDDPLPYYQAADLFLLPSAYETFSLVAWEAAASGLPIVATAVHGIADLVGEGEAGIIITRDVREVARAAVKLALNPDLRQQLGHEARRRATELTWDTVVSKLEAAMEEHLRAGA